MAYYKFTWERPYAIFGSETNPKYFISVDIDNVETILSTEYSYPWTNPKTIGDIVNYKADPNIIAVSYKSESQTTRVLNELVIDATGVTGYVSLKIKNDDDDVYIDLLGESIGSIPIDHTMMTYCSPITTTTTTTIAP